MQTIGKKAPSSFANIGTHGNPSAIHTRILIVSLLASVFPCGCSISGTDNENASDLLFCCAQVCKVSSSPILRLGALLSNGSDSRRYLECVGGVHLLEKVSFVDVESGVELPLSHEVSNNALPVRIEFCPDEKLCILNTYILPSLRKGCYRVSFSLPWDVNLRHSFVVCVQEDMASSLGATSKNSVSLCEIERMGGEVNSWYTNSVSSLSRGIDYDLIRSEVFRIARLGSVRIYDNDAFIREINNLQEATGSRNVQATKIDKY